MHSLPIFPLGGVLLPGGRMPLQLFEPRYLALAQRLAAEPEQERRFGIVRIRQGHEVGEGAATELHEVGCEAVADAMALAQAGAGAVVHLVARGARRFRLEGLDEDAGTPYLTGRVSWLREGGEDDHGLDELCSRVLRAHARYLDAVGAGADPVEARPGQLAYRVVERMVLDPVDQQRVLEGPDAADRLRRVLTLLARETAIVERFGALPTPPDPGGASLS
ncbi:LON peptidase substrate-binding domain-containing protein [Phycicoccus endophyticus]|uniref:LON peptidase substrate-binding domain-containing protein n=1 Tax=Phycicoccus endophyticus TaxID=1690220 RepID=A0A7G9R141_9MICO|nr:LON peptidase substrate-binding domain-containing protein [Phycicoccus endophyticus]NHI20555.1 LON peptidase substrate-binding domain-containing protein [Phycicoccus endophyticus]QNN49316.1 LON peptidase substrate-binding domain-containing protein [Phycicoccus endophyticus]GGL45139.1 peptidase [Phycicoccus endophyticus]